MGKIHIVTLELDNFSIYSIHIKAAKVANKRPYYRS